MYLLDPDALFSYGKLNIVMTYIPTGENIYSPCVAKCSVQNLDDNLGPHLLWNASNMKWNTCVGLILFVAEQSTGVCMGISFTLLPQILCVLFRKRPLPTSQQKKVYKKKKGKKCISFLISNNNHEQYCQRHCKKYKICGSQVLSGADINRSDKWHHRFLGEE